MADPTIHPSEITPPEVYFDRRRFLRAGWWDRDGSLGRTLDEIIARRYLWFGFGALLLMLPLAITSTDRMVRRLGARRWRQLHRLVYPAVIAGVVHYYLLVKADTSQPRAFAIVLGALLGFRLVAGVLDRRRQAARKQGRRIHL